MYDRPALPALDVDTRCVARYDLVVLDEDFVLRPRLNHDAAALEVLEFALFDVHLGVDGD